MSNPEYIIYKNSVQQELSNIVMYLHSQGISMMPKAIFERGHPIQIIKLPSIYDITDKKLYHGLDESVKFFEKKTKFKKLLVKSLDFKEKNPNYCV